MQWTLLHCNVLQGVWVLRCNDATTGRLIEPYLLPLQGPFRQAMGLIEKCIPVADDGLGQELTWPQAAGSTRLTAK
jgi:hypothetical protein